MRDNNIPTASYYIFEDYDSAYAHLNNENFPVVIKADGLAAGKGAVICETRKDAGRIYKGLLYVGLMMREGFDVPYVVEFNCRFGDPETQIVLPLFDGDLVQLMLDSIDENINENGSLPYKNMHSVCIVAASGGYPDNYEKGKIIKGLDQVKNDVQIIHAGTKLENGNLITNGGRVFAAVSTNPSIKEAAESAYGELRKISFDKMYYRDDIANKELNRK